MISATGSIPKRRLPFSGEAQLQKIQEQCDGFLSSTRESPLPFPAIEVPT